MEKKKVTYEKCPCCGKPDKGVHSRERPYCFACMMEYYIIMEAELDSLRQYVR